MAKRKDKPDSPTIENRRARFDYAITEELEVGIILKGSEVKAVRNSLISLGEGFVRVAENPPTLELYNVMIGDYGPAAALGHKQVRPRGLLAKKQEIIRLYRKVQVKGMTIVPLKMYFKNGYAKLLIGLGKGKTKGDRRETIAKREAKRDMDRAVSRRR
jgi:SsrA-binding protein